MVCRPKGRPAAACSNLAAAWQQPGSSLAATWQQPGSSLAEARSSLAAAWQQPGSSPQQPGSSLAEARSSLQQPGSSLAEAWQQPGSSLQQPVAAWQQPATAWQHHSHDTVNTVDQILTHWISYQSCEAVHCSALRLIHVHKILITNNPGWWCWCWCWWYWWYWWCQWCWWCWASECPAGFESIKTSVDVDKHFKKTQTSKCLKHKLDLNSAVATSTEHHMIYFSFLLARLTILPTHIHSVLVWRRYIFQ